MRPRNLLALCALVALGLTGYALLAPSGMPKWRHKEREVAALRGDVARLERENERLTREAARLQEGAPGADVYLEAAAREELGWVKPDEHVLLLAQDGTEAGADGVQGGTP